MLCAGICRGPSVRGESDRPRVFKGCSSLRLGRWPSFAACSRHHRAVAGATCRGPDRRPRGRPQSSPRACQAMLATVSARYRGQSSSLSATPGTLPSSSSAVARACLAYPLDLDELAGENARAFRRRRRRGVPPLCNLSQTVLVYSSRSRRGLPVKDSQPPV
jgi:hypothetical protein